MLKLLQHQESCYSSGAARIATGGSPRLLKWSPRSHPPHQLASSEVEHSGISMIGGHTRHNLIAVIAVKAREHT